MIVGKALWLRYSENSELLYREKNCRGNLITTPGGSIPSIIPSCYQWKIELPREHLL